MVFVVGEKLPIEKNESSLLLRLKTDKQFAFALLPNTVYKTRKSAEKSKEQDEKLSPRSEFKVLKFKSLKDVV